MTENHPESGPTSRPGGENAPNPYPSDPPAVTTPQNGTGRVDPVSALAQVLWERWQHPEPGIPGVLINADPRTVAQAVLASGVVVAADKVRALAGDHDLRVELCDCAWSGERDQPHAEDCRSESAALALLSLLSEPATPPSDSLAARVRALADEWDKLSCHTGYQVTNQDRDDAHCLHCSSDELVNLLSEPATDAASEPASELEVPGDAPTPVAPATDAAPTGEAQACAHDWRDVADVVDHQICRLCSTTRLGHAADWLDTNNSQGDA